LLCTKGGKIIGLFLSICLVGCATQNGKFYDGKTLPSDKVAEVSLLLETPSNAILTSSFSKSLDVRIDKYQLVSFNKKQTIGYLKPGSYEFKLVSNWWERENKTKNTTRDVASLPCSLGVYVPFPFLPLAITCGALMPDKKCNSIWTMELEAGKQYKIDVDWAAVPPRTIVENETDQLEAISIACDIQKTEKPK
jgi:hypothetical protein